LAEAARLLDQDADQPVDPLAVLLGAVRSSAALLGAAQAAVKADEPDADALHQLAEAALLSARLAKMALDSGVEARLTAQAERAGAMVGAMVSKVVNGLELPPAVSAAAFRLVRREVELERLDLGPYAGLSMAELDVEIARTVAELDAADARDAVNGFPGRLAGCLAAALDALELPDADRERAVAAAEAWLAADAAERAEREQTRHQRAGLVQSSAWWVKPAGNGHGNGRR
jgi:hypothetical protein